MPTNTEVTTQLVPQAVPPDRECDIGNLSAIIKGVTDFTSIQQVSGEGGASTGDSIAQQALEKADIALAKATEADGKIPQKRYYGEPVDVPTGDSNFMFTWAPPMPDTNYEVRGMFFGSAAETVVGGWIVVTGTKTVNSVQIRLINVPANQQFTAVVEQLPTI